MALWSSRFSGSMAADTLSYTQTTDIDVRMLRHDLWGSLAHILMLCSSGIVDEEVAKSISREIIELLDQAHDGTLILDPALEDVHLNIESRIIGSLDLSVGGRLHTARSRNDQVVTDSRMCVREGLLQIGDALASLIEATLDQAEQQAETLTLGYTHSQAAQPITFGFWLSSHASAWIRDLTRITCALKTTNINPLGGCALSGTSFPIDRGLTTRLLGFDDVLRNALDATSARDFMAEASSACAILMTQISRLAEEIVCWSSFEVGIIQVDDAYATGSSIMPQKKNPVVAELARARTASAIGCLTEILGIIKSVSMGYSCDLQQDKPPMWRSLDIAFQACSIFSGQIRSLRFKSNRAEDNCWLSHSTATELANLLVTRYGKPFRGAYEIVGNLVRHLESEKITLRDTNAVCSFLSDFDIIADQKEVSDCVDPRHVVMRQNSEGGTSPDAVRATIVHLRSELGLKKAIIADMSSKVDNAYSVTMHIAKLFVDSRMPGNKIRSAAFNDVRVTAR